LQEEAFGTAQLEAEKKQYFSKPQNIPSFLFTASATLHYPNTPAKNSHINKPFTGLSQSRSLPAQRDLRHNPILY
jgi:hypothetical protein